MTIKDISVLTGYSVGTVSRVLNDQPNVSEKARNTILDACRQHGFQINANARQLKQQRANTILVIAKGTSNQLFSSLLEHIQAQIASWPYPLIVDYVDEDDNEVVKSIQLYREKKPLGMIYLGGNLENFRRYFRDVEVPCVLVTGDASALGLGNLSSVTTDDRRSGYLAVDHLVRLGHRQIAVIGGDSQVSDISRFRLEGCLAAFEAHGIEFDRQADYVGGRFSYSDGYRAVKTLVERGREFTAIFAMADVMAIGAIRALRDVGLRVPEDVSVIGLDGLAVGDYTIPKLATVRQPVHLLARHSLKLLLDQIEAGAAAAHETVPPTVEWKESTRKI